MREIVVGIDDSVASARALDRGLLEAESTGRPLRGVHVWSPPPWLGLPAPAPGRGSAPSVVPAHDETSAAQLLDELLAKGLQRRTSPRPVDVRSGAVQGSPGPELVRAATDAGLLVVGGRGQRTATGALLGPTTAHVLHHAGCPVMVVPAQVPPVARFRRVVVGVDGSPSARSALRWAADAARRHDCHLVAAYAWQTNTLKPPSPMQFMHPRAEYEAEARSWLDQELAEALPERPGVHLRKRLVHSTPAWGLLQVSGPDDLLVVGSRGRGGFARLVLGSVATQCSQHARGPVVVVRADQERCVAGE